MSSNYRAIPRAAIADLFRRETARFVAANPRSKALAERARAHLPNAVPMHWMTDWQTPFPLFMASAQAARMSDVDGHGYDDFCLGDTGTMYGHVPPPVARAVQQRLALGFAAMLPNEDGVAAAENLAQRFGLPFWQMATTATDANRFVIRWARAITGRPFLLVFNGCYHGSVDDTFLRLKQGRTILRPGVLGQVQDLTKTTRVVEFNDLESLEKALAPGDVAAVLQEPAMTNIGMVLPQPGFQEALRELTRRHGTLLINDETHCISTGPGGFTRAHGLDPDMLTLGKPIAGGIPCSVFGFTAEIEAAMRRVSEADPGYSGMGTTLSGNALTLATMRATLEEVMTEAAYERMLALSARLAAGLERVIGENALAWHVQRVGARAEWLFSATAPRNGSEAEAAFDHELERALHLYLLNRGLLIAPFHNMTLSAPVTEEAQVDRLVGAVEGAVKELLA
ncbi:MAG TPA: aspartate aminotransferase family protein [Dongiaceae bacterium]|nr:aspartate aminotransferase family protein [Dongiaceae bacterium]